jgi:outer membrane protein assembly factor BamA
MKSISGCCVAATMAALLLASAARAQETSIKPVIGGFPADSGFALGAQASRTRIAGPVGAHVKGVVSVKKYQLYEGGLDVPELGRWLSLAVVGRYRIFPQDAFWGLGPNTKPADRANYLYEDLDTGVTLSTSIRKFRAGTEAGYTEINTGRGRDTRYPSIPESLQSQPRFVHVGAFVEYDTYDEEGDPHDGSKLRFAWTTYASYLDRFTVDLRRFIPIGESDRLGLRLQSQFTHSSLASSELPFFLLPTAGGTNTVRGFNQYRFRDRNALVMNAEYRRPLNAFLDAVAFVDAGRVFSRPENIGLQHLHPSAGIGARIKFGSRVFFGVDLGISSETKRLWFRSEQMF